MCQIVAGKYTIPLCSPHYSLTGLSQSETYCFHLCYSLKIPYIYPTYFEHINHPLPSNSSQGLTTSLVPLCVFLSSFHSPSSPISDVYTCTGVGPSTGAWTTSQELLLMRTFFFLHACWAFSGSLCKSVCSSSSNIFFLNRSSRVLVPCIVRALRLVTSLPLFLSFTNVGN